MSRPAFTMTVAMSNAAFAEGCGAAELARILRQLASKLENTVYNAGEVESGNLVDCNGNTVGPWFCEWPETDEPEAEDDEGDEPDPDDDPVPSLGQRDICARCDLEIEWVGFWHDRGGNKLCPSTVKPHEPVEFGKDDEPDEYADPCPINRRPKSSCPDSCKHGED